MRCIALLRPTHSTQVLKFPFLGSVVLFKFTQTVADGFLTNTYPNPVLSQFSVAPGMICPRMMDGSFKIIRPEGWLEMMYRDPKRQSAGFTTNTSLQETRSSFWAIEFIQFGGLNPCVSCIISGGGAFIAS